ADEADVPNAGTGGVRKLARRFERNIFYRDAQARRDLSSKIGCHALGIAGRAPARHQQKVREVDAGAQHASRRKFGDDFGRHRGVRSKEGESKQVWASSYVGAIKRSNSREPGAPRSAQCPLLEAKRTFLQPTPMSVIDPKRTFADSSLTLPV